MAKKKSAAPKVEPKKVESKPRVETKSLEEIKNEVFGEVGSPLRNAYEKSLDREVRKALAKLAEEKQGTKDDLYDIPKVEYVQRELVHTRFKVGEIIKHDNRLYKCVAINGNELAVFGPYSQQNSRVKYSGMFAVDNGSLKNDTFEFERVS